MADKQKQQTLRAHPVAECFPPLSETEFSDLLADVREHGVRVPIVTTADGLIVDGLHRWRAASEAGVECPSVQLPAGDDAWQAGVKLNLARRHMNETQRAMVAARLSQDSTHGGDRSEQPANLPVAFTQDKAAEVLSVSGRSVRSARRVIDQAAPVVVERVEAGELSVSDAEAVVAAPPDIQTQAVERVMSGEVRTLREAVSLIGEDSGPKLPARAIAKDKELREKLEHITREILELRRQQIENMGSTPAETAAACWRKMERAEDQQRRMVEQGFVDMLPDDYGDLIDLARDAELIQIMDKVPDVEISAVKSYGAAHAWEHGRAAVKAYAFLAETSVEAVDEIYSEQLEDTERGIQAGSMAELIGEALEQAGRDWEQWVLADKPADAFNWLAACVRFLSQTDLAPVETG